MKCLSQVFDSRSLRGWSERPHLSYHNEIRPAILNANAFKRSFRDRHTIVFGLLRERGPHPGTRVIRFQRSDCGPLRPVRVSEESPGEYSCSGSDPVAIPAVRLTNPVRVEIARRHTLRC